VRARRVDKWHCCDFSEMLRAVLLFTCVCVGGEVCDVTLRGRAQQLPRSGNVRQVRDRRTGLTGRQSALSCAASSIHASIHPSSMPSAHGAGAGVVLVCLYAGRVAGCMPLSHASGIVHPSISHGQTGRQTTIHPSLRVSARSLLFWMECQMALGLKALSLPH